ncbi:MAG: Gfo/Idh/MocA family oxidoreductase [Alphaproteobacteria bacterium]|nr:Gfo/Idh/MocA family oxidoreductase [Alphaproteobacteria bacterium]
MEIRFGVVGTAYWAAAVHTVGLGAVPGARLAGIWGRDVDKARALAAQRGTVAFESFEAMLAAVDAVSLAVPPQVQESLALRAIAAGKHVLLEKPIATTHRRAVEIADAVAARGVASMVFFTRRFVPELAAAIERHAARDWQRAEIEVRSAALSAGSPYEHSSWRLADGAALWDIGPHVLSVLIAMLGPVVGARRLPAPARVVRFETRHARGASASVSLTLHATPAEQGQRYRFMDAADEFVLPEPAFERPTAYANAVVALVAAIAGGARAHPCDVRLGAETVRILEAVARAT